MAEQTTRCCLHPIVYLDCIVLKIRHEKRVINKAVYLALGINMEGQKELLGIWIAESRVESKPSILRQFAPPHQTGHAVFPHPAFLLSSHHYYQGSQL